MPERIANLKRGMDEKSKRNIDAWMKRALFFPDAETCDNYRLRKSYVASFQTDDEKKSLQEECAEWPKYKEQYKMPRDEFNIDTFFYHHGLRFAPQKVRDYVAGRDFIDAGAYVGDSAAVLSMNYNPRKVWSFEILDGNYKKLKETIALNNVAQKVEAVNMALSDMKKTVLISGGDGQGGSLLSAGSHKIQCVDLDSFADEHRLDVGFIKADIEGTALDMSRGMLQTIKKNRPVMAISVYHNPIEFFEVKPLIESVAPDYKMSMIKMYTSVEIMDEICLFAYPKELDDL
jgi:FkbM family methyltransferase